MTRTKKSVQTFPESHQDPNPSHSTQPPEDGTSYFDYLLELADRLLEGRGEDELQTA